MRQKPTDRGGTECSQSHGLIHRPAARCSDSCFPAAPAELQKCCVFRDCSSERGLRLGRSSQADRLSDNAQPSWNCIQIFYCQFLQSREHKCLKLSLTMTLGNRIPPHNSNSTLPNKPEICCFCLPRVAGRVHSPACCSGRGCSVCSGCWLGKSVFARTHQAGSSC